MKYIRTKDSIIDSILLFNNYKYCGGKQDYNNFIQESDLDIVKQSNTIEELCDEFVFEDMDGHYLCDFCEQTDIDVGSKFDELKYWFNHSKEQQYKTRNCYGAIWTDKGLIYVAKMNYKGELELLWK